MDKINHTEFKKTIFKKGKFEPYIISPYASTEKHCQKVLLFSSKVQKPTIHEYNRRTMSLILPYGDSIQSHLETIKEYTGVDATYFGIFDLAGNQLSIYP